MAGPNLPKKLKSEEPETRYFENFLKDETNQCIIKELRLTLPLLRLGLERLKMSFLRVLSSNATMVETFSNAKVQVEHIQNEQGIPVTAPIAVFFLKGVKILHMYLDEENLPHIPEDMMERRSLRDLLQFLTEDHAVLAENKRKEELEWKWAVRFAQHLLIPLVPQKTFVVDSYSGLNLQLCCSDEHPVLGEVGDTSFGCTEGWHGEVDMLVGKEVPISIEGAEEGSEALSVSSDSTMEVKKEKNFLKSDKQQVMAQTIVFSFLHHKENGDVLSKSLVPGIGLCAEKFIVYMYDCVDDVFLRALPLDMFVDLGRGILNIRAVIVLWLFLNYGLFRNCIPKSFKRYKSEFHQRVGPEFLDMYMNKVGRPCHVKLPEKDENEYWANAFCHIDAFDYFPEYLSETKFIPLQKH